MRNKILFSALIISMSFTFSSCFKDLDLEPPNGVNSASVYADADNYINVLAKLYSGLALTGNQGPAGNPDIGGIDEGFSGYIRVMWNMQEICTDEAKCAWTDDGIPELDNMTWTSSNSFVTAMYYRIYFQIPLCNEFISQSSEDNMTAHGFADADKEKIRGYVAEARFLRALSYYHAMDLFGSVPFITEEDGVGAFLPDQISRADLFSYIESELLAIEPNLPEPHMNEYARADKAAVWTLLSKLYLNAEVYTGTQRYADCANWCSKIIAAGYSLEADYTHLFLADNNLSNEIIFAVPFDGQFTQTFGGTTFLTHSSIAGTGPMSDADSSYFGVQSGWGGNRATPEFAAKFPDTDDSRNLFFTDGQTSLTFSSDGDLSTFLIGWPVAKWRNVTSTGEIGSDPAFTYCDIDFPMFRLADVYLMYAECAARGFADAGAGMGYVNQLRERAYGDASHDVAEINPASVLDERARELHWEGYRRTDLIRYGLFTGGSYVWAFKGGSYTGSAVDGHLNLYPLPSSDIVANPNLTQNPGY